MFGELLDEFYEYLVTVNPKNAKKYKRYILNVYNEIPGANILLDGIAIEKSVDKKLEYCEEVKGYIYTEREKTHKSSMDCWITAMNSLIKFIKNKEAIIVGKSGVLRKKGIEKIQFEGVLNPLLNGTDENALHIRYDDDVLPEEMVSHLCSCLEKEYGRIIEFAFHVFHSCFDGCNQDFNRNLFNRIPVILSKECPGRIYKNDDKYITKKVNELIKNNKLITEKEMSRILRKASRIAGEFHNKDQPHIVLYYRQIDATNMEEYLSRIVNVFAHEYAHYLEYEYCRCHKTESYQDECISEAIADFFSVLYSVDRCGRYDEQTAYNKYLSWVECFGSNWPYANAYYFYHMNGKIIDFLWTLPEYQSCGMIEKLRAVFANTNNIKIAWKKLIE